MKIIPHLAKYGDCIQLRWKNNGLYSNILIDGGPRSSFDQGLHSAISSIISLDESVDLLIITHYDNDHIGGILELFSTMNPTFIKQVWFNSKSVVKKTNLNRYEEKFEEISNINPSTILGTGEAKLLSKILIEKGFNWHDEPILSGHEIIINGLQILVLNPNLEDLIDLFPDDEQTEVKVRNEDNKKSIKLLQTKPDDLDSKLVHRSAMSFIFKYKSKQFLFLSDNTIDSVLDALNKRFEHDINFDLVKLSHHGSRKNISKDFIEKIKCSKFLISTNGQSYNHPDKETLSKIIYSNYQRNKSTEFILNYPLSTQYFHKDEYEKYKFCLNVKKRFKL